MHPTLISPRPLFKHNLLIYKVKRMAIDGTLLQWLESSLTGRIQVVTVHGYQ